MFCWQLARKRVPCRESKLTAKQCSPIAEILLLSEIPKVDDRGLAPAPSALNLLRSSAHLGTEVTILEALPRVVPLEDEENFAGAWRRPSKKKGIRIETESKVEAVKKKDAHGAIVTFKGQNGQITNH